MIRLFTTQQVITNSLDKYLPILSIVIDMHINILGKAYPVSTLILQFVHFNAILIVSAFTHVSKDYGSVKGKCVAKQRIWNFEFLLICKGTIKLFSVVALIKSEMFSKSDNVCYFYPFLYFFGVNILNDANC